MQILAMLLFVVSLAAASHEIASLVTISVVEPAGSKITRFLIFGIVLLLVMHERTSIFDKGLFRISTRACRIAIATFTSAVLVIYVLRFSAVPLTEMIHRYAPVNAVLAILFFLYAVIALASDSFLGKMRTVFKWWRNDKSA